MKTDIIYNEGDKKIAIAKMENIDKYIEAFYNCDDEINYLTGSESHYEESAVREFYARCTEDDNRCDFLIFDNDKIIGEVVINEIDYEVKSGHYRICLFYADYLGKGHGTFATKSILNFAFKHLQLQRVGLEVYSFNDRAIKMYEKIGFIREGRLRNAILSRDGYADIICMSMLKDEYMNTL